MNLKDHLVDSLLLSKGVGSRYLDKLEFKYKSLWVSPYIIHARGIHTEVITENKYQEAISLHWLYIEEKHKDYVFYLEY